MEVDLNTLLVALMYVTILSMGIGNLITSFASLRFRESGAGLKIAASWQFLLLIYHLHLFWLTKALLEVDDWRFYGFLFVITGPILMFMCASLAIDAASREEDHAESGFISQRFFVLFAIAQLWLVTSGYMIAGDLALEDIPLIGMTVLLLALTPVRQERLHALGAALAWVLVVVSIVISVARTG